MLPEGLFSSYFHSVLYVEKEVHNVAVLHHVFLSLDSHLTGGATSGFRLEIHEIIVFDDLGTDETLFEVGVNDTCRTRSLVPLVYGPGATLVRARREEGLKAKQMVCALYQANHSGFFE